MSGIPVIKAEHYETKRKDYMVPDWDEDSTIDQFEITIQSQDPVELRRQVCASMTAFWQADDAYMEVKQRIAQQDAEIERLKNRHVRFMVEGGPVVMASEYDALAATVETLKGLLRNCRNGLELLLQSHKPEHPDDPFDTINELRETVRQATVALCARQEKQV